MGRVGPWLVLNERVVIDIVAAGGVQLTGLLRLPSQSIGAPIAGQSGEVMPLGRYEVASLDDVEQAAEELRDEWRLGRDPIARVVDVLDADGPEAFDGLSAVARSGGQPVAAAVARSGVPGERQRLRLGHELAHLVLRAQDGVDEEKAAYRFGAALLAPREALLAEVGSSRREIRPDELLMLKRRFGMSLAALVADHLEIVEAIVNQQQQLKEGGTMATKKVNKSAVTGRFVKSSTLKRNPRTTYKQTVKKSKKKS